MKILKKQNKQIDDCEAKVDSYRAQEFLNVTRERVRVCIQLYGAQWKIHGTWSIWQAKYLKDELSSNSYRSINHPI